MKERIAEDFREVRRIRPDLVSIHNNLKKALKLQEK